VYVVRQPIHSRLSGHGRAMAFRVRTVTVRPVATSQSLRPKGVSSSSANQLANPERASAGLLSSPKHFRLRCQTESFRIRGAGRVCRGARPGEVNVSVSRTKHVLAETINRSIKSNR
jgi:hypothetical protein